MIQDRTFLFSVDTNRLLYYPIIRIAILMADLKIVATRIYRINKEHWSFREEMH